MRNAKAAQAPIVVKKTGEHIEVAGEWEDFERDGHIVARRYVGVEGNKFVALGSVAQRLEPVWKLSRHPINPRRGNIPMIRASLRYHGQFREVLANVGTISQRYEPGTIAGGNHTFGGALQEGWTHIGVTWIDVDDDELDRINLMDNFSADAAHYDTPSLIAVTSRLSDYEGTGVSKEFIASLVKKDESGSRAARRNRDKPVTTHKCPECGHEWE